MAKDMVVADFSDYAVEKNREMVREVIRENLQGDTVAAFELDRVKFPSGGAGFFEVPSVDGDATADKEIVGVIVHQRIGRRYFSKPYEDGGGEAPDCFCEDGITGIGDPGGDCSTCPHSEWGSSQKGSGRGQACGERRVLFVLKQEELLPIVVDLPPTSLKAWKSYLLGLTSRATPYYAVVTSIGLTKKPGESGEYSVATFKRAASLDEEQTKSIKAYRGDVVDKLQAVKIGDVPRDDELDDEPDDDDIPL